MLKGSPYNLHCKNGSRQQLLLGTKVHTPVVSPKSEQIFHPSQVVCDLLIYNLEKEFKSIKFY